VPAPTNLARDQRAPFFHRIDDGLARAPGVVSTGGTSIAPFSGQTISTQFLAEGHEDRRDEFFAADWRSVMPGFFNTLGIKLVRGRLLQLTDDDNHPTVAVIDETMAARLWPGQNPLGKHITIAQSARSSRDQFEVVGVVRDIHERSLATDPYPAVYFTEDQRPFQQMNFLVKVRGNYSAAVSEQLRRAFHDAAPAIAFPPIVPLADNIGTAMAPQRFIATLIAGFAAVALLLAAIGLFGIVSFSVQQRIPEMGVRVAFGATPGRIMRLVIGDAGRVVAVGLVLGCIGAFAFSRLLSSMLFATAPTDPTTYAAVIVILMITCVAASFVPARRAGQVDALVTLRGA